MLDFITQRELPSVLLIDDDMVSREVMATVLTMNGYPVHTAETGEAAVEMLRRRRLRSRRRSHGRAVAGAARR